MCFCCVRQFRQVHDTQGSAMIQGIYLATQGMTTLIQKQDQIANNLANVNTNGFKQSGLFVQAFQKYLDDDQQRPFANREIKADKVYVDYREGTLRKTGGTLDIAIRGSGFLTVMTERGVRYTRNGGLSLDPEGFLITAAGDRLMGKEGYIRLEPDGQPVRFTDQGEVMQGTMSKGTLRISDFAKPYRLIREGAQLFRPQMPDNPPVESGGFVIRQGYVEGSNVNLVQNLVQMISAHRTYEADQRALSAQNETLDKAVNQVGRLS